MAPGGSWWLLVAPGGSWWLLAPWVHAPAAPLTSSAPMAGAICTILGIILQAICTLLDLGFSFCMLFAHFWNLNLSVCILFPFFGT